MNREELEAYIQNHYATLSANSLLPIWYAARSKMTMYTVMSFSARNSLMASLRGENGIFPAYHMNKASWITAALDGSVPAETIELLLDVSYELTKPKIRRKTANRKEADDTKI